MVLAAASAAAAAWTTTDCFWFFTFGHISYYRHDNSPVSYLLYLAVSGPGKQPSRAASGSKQAHNWGGGSVSRGCDPRGCVACC